MVIIYLKNYDNNTEIRRRLYVFTFCFSFSLSDTQKRDDHHYVLPLLLLLFVLFITFVQGIYNYIPQTGHISMVHSVAALLYSQFMVHMIGTYDDDDFVVVFCFCFCCCCCFKS